MANFIFELLIAIIGVFFVYKIIEFLVQNKGMVMKTLIIFRNLRLIP